MSYQSNQNRTASINLTPIILVTPSAELYDTLAESTAKTIANPAKRGVNKASQLRGFYDELVMWEQRLRQATDIEFNQQLPLIRMINAKVAYAKGRDLVDENYFQLIRHCLNQIKDKETLRNCKLFLEAFMGFYKVYGEK
ncbi:type III-A CRISPR-associated protein Csm2 [Nitrincola tibetensis]|uniref:CRISPR system Cms protein Csm2 n=1 Tax=Nitrincola tibetensis TaxID=2219697 RepID=A0A364NKP5_9GAMM|nr:type III-A CRISPR-associated protein Csm2 [Nitrincola tibetensis]RAU17611.1 type III-A CRISPR-associated protein Csm2 [Nitrincola tibetensis]